VNRRLRVAQIVCSTDFAGVERYVANLSTGLGAAGCDVIVLGGEAGRMSRELSGAETQWWPARTMGEAAVRLARLGRLDIVHTHMTEAETAAASVRVMTRGRFVTTRHFAARRGAHLSGRLAGVGIRRLVDVQLAISDYVAARVDGPSVVLHPGVPSEASASSINPSIDRAPVVLVAQRLEAEKKTDVALYAWRRSGLARQGWELHLAGGGAQEQSLRSLAKELEIDDSCRFLGPRDDLSERYHRASLFFAPTPDEGLGLAVVEAMAAGLPVVASGAGGHLETVGACPEAALFAPGDIDGAALLLRSLGADERRRLAYGEELQAIQREYFDASTQARRMASMYEALVGSQPRRS
jgi:glycosyltransferase involved in cell wall biosynthesis